MPFSLKVASSSKKSSCVIFDARIWTKSFESSTSSTSLRTSSGVTRSSSGPAPAPP
eukprot:CAMPEP_0181371034 /NCGR_PEP_ID=MMETSP1106-20121128/13803_1 /TAXON_ID=81844 /ORGANISM="Mantoniella antarctica, Strain SL-175" /LENGTH=55 /DNA_ID=CAMNT_0023487985 /DNA_START=428 /DNA_END=592 /DNA_ORIENTATION=+